MIALPPHKVSRAGFTLIELLAALAVIVLLAALIVPFIGSSLGKARNSRCQSHLRQIGSAFQMYAAENGGSLPYQITSRDDGALSWDYMLLGYADSFYANMEPGAVHSQLMNNEPPGVFACPSSTVPSRGTVQLSSYGVNGTLVRAGNVAADRLRPRVKLSDIAEPSRTYLAADATARSFAHHSQGVFLAAPEKGEPVTERHGGMVNMLYVDGRVEPLRPSQMEWSATAVNVADRAPWGAP